MKLLDLKFVIPSYKRSNIIKTHTLALLELFEIPKNLIYIFVVPDEYELYKQHLPEYKHIIIGQCGLANQRNFITNYFKEGQMLVCLDDDLKSFQMLEDGIIKPINTYEQFTTFIYKGFDCCKDSNAYLWGIHQTYNPRFMRESVTFHFSFIVGHFWGCINRHLPELNITKDIKEDYERTIKYWLKDKCIIKLNYISANNKIYKTTGGLQETHPDRTQASIDSCNWLIETYPDYFTKRETKLNSQQKSQYMELKLKKHSSSANCYKSLQTIESNCPIVLELIKAFENTVLPIYKKRLNAGDGMTHVFGKHRIRKKSGLYESKNNTRYPSLYNAILEFANKYVKPHIDYTGIQVNKNYKAKPHLDARNNGDSYLVALGDYTGGSLIINSYKKDIKYQPILFNGADWKHSVDDFEGNRYSLVFFNQKTEKIEEKLD